MRTENCRCYCRWSIATDCETTTNAFQLLPKTTEQEALWVGKVLGGAAGEALVLLNGTPQSAQRLTAGLVVRILAFHWNQRRIRGCGDAIVRIHCAHIFLFQFHQICPKHAEQLFRWVTKVSSWTGCGGSFLFTFNATVKLNLAPKRAEFFG